jgi:hypothetical protein
MNIKEILPEEKSRLLQELDGMRINTELVASQLKTAQGRLPFLYLGGVF